MAPDALAPQKYKEPTLTSRPASNTRPSSSSSRALRGSACLSCRRRKLRCDSVRPKCGPCVRGNREQDCEYTDGPTRSATQILEDEIARLEARIYELEHPESVMAPVILHDPRAHSLQLQTSASSEERSGPISDLSLPDDHGSPATPSICNEPGYQMIQTLVGYFIPNASQVGFFLHNSRFLDAILVPDTATRTALLPRALLNAVYLWGVRLSGNDALLAHEPNLLSCAAQATSVASASVPTYKFTHFIQAEILLATYYLTTGRFLEGHYHCSAAVALCLSGRLNQIRGVNHPMPHVYTAGTVKIALPPPTDSVEEGERVNAFWTVYMLDKCWTVPLGSPSHINGGAILDIPWPLEMEEYERGGFAPNVVGVCTMESFLNDTPSTSGNGTSSLALSAKAAALCERATRLSSQWSPTMANAQQLFAHVYQLDSVIDRFVASLMPIEAATTPYVARDLLVVHSLALAATVQLYANFPEGVMRLGNSKKLAAAKLAATLLDRIDLRQFVHINSILAIIWTTVVRVLIEELTRLNLAAQAEVSGMIQKIFLAMSIFSRTAPLMGSQLTKVRHELEQANR